MITNEQTPQVDDFDWKNASYFFKVLRRRGHGLFSCRVRSTSRACLRYDEVGTVWPHPDLRKIGLGLMAFKNEDDVAAFVVRSGLWLSGPEFEIWECQGIPLEDPPPITTGFENVDDLVQTVRRVSWRRNWKPWFKRSLWPKAIFRQHWVSWRGARNDAAEYRTTGLPPGTVHLEALRLIRRCTDLEARPAVQAKLSEYQGYQW